MSITYNILKDYGILGDSEKKMAKHLVLIEWGDKGAKYDIRGWNENFEKMSKGITLTRQEMKDLKELLNNMDLEEF